MSDNKGSALATVIILSSILLVFVATFGLSATSNIIQATRQQKHIKAYYIAMAGANATSKGILSASEEKLNTFANLQFPIESDAVPFGEGHFTVTIKDYPDKLEIESIGRVRGRTDDYIEATAIRVIEKETEQVILSEIPFAIFANGHITINHKIDGNIATSSYERPAITIGDGIQEIKDGSSKATVYLPRGSDYETAIDWPPWWDLPSNIEVTTTPPDDSLPDIADLEELYPEPKLPDFPTNLPNKGSIILGGGVGTETISGDGYYEKVTVGGSKTLIIDTSDNGITRIRVGTLHLDRGDRISTIIDVVGDGKAYIYVDDVAKFNGTVRATNPEDVVFYMNPDTLSLGGDIKVEASLYLGDTDVNISGSCSIDGDIIVSRYGSVRILGASNVDLGTIYAPYADVEITGGGKVAGAVIGNNVSVSGGASIVYSEPHKIIAPIETIATGRTVYKEGYWK